MPWDHINKVINRSLPLQQPSKAASSHSSMHTNSRQRNGGLRKPHLLSCCFYLSLHCISCQGCRSERPEISLYLCACHGVTKDRASDGAQLHSGARLCAEESAGQVETEGQWAWALVAVRHQQPRLTQLRVGAGAQTAFLPHSHRTHGGLDLAFPELSSQCHSRNPKNTVFFILASQIPGISLVILLAKGRILCTPGVFWGTGNLWENEGSYTFQPFFLFCCYRGCSHTFSKS